MAPVELLTPAEMAEADRLTIAAGTKGFALMQSAGLAVAEAASQIGADGSILVLAGPGNNGGDGFVAAAQLRRAGRSVRLALLGPREALNGDTAKAAQAYGAPVESLTPDTELRTDLIIDALFGAGLARPLEGAVAQIVAAVNASGRPVLAVDLPSGIDGRTGGVQGEAVRATRTVTFFRLKPGHLLLPGRAHCGHVELAQIGIRDCVLAPIGPSTFHNLPGLWRHCLRAPATEDHKYTRGHVVVVSGPMTSTGAARLAAAGALRIGAGAVTVASPADALLVNAAHLTAIMLRPFGNAVDLAEMTGDPRITAIVAGPGNGSSRVTRDNVEALMETKAALVLDADALTSCAPDRKHFFRTIAGRHAPVVLTPHEGEFVRLFPQEGAKIDRARAAAAESGAVVVLKGPDTVIASPDGRLAINSNAPPDLATAGSGDVLAGMAAGLLGQGLPAFEAASAAVWLHGEAGLALGRGLIAEDLPSAIPGVLQRLAADDPLLTRP